MFYTHQAVPIKLADLLQPTDANALARLAYGNLLLAAFNLLPAFPMDGGRILRALLSYIRPEDQATRIGGLDGPDAGHQHGALRPARAAVHAGVLRVFHLPGRGAGKRGGDGAHAHPRHSGARGDDHRIPHARARQHDSRRGESAAVHVAAGFSGDPQRTGGGPAGAQSAAQIAGRGRPRRLCGGSDGSRFYLARARDRIWPRCCR